MKLEIERVILICVVDVILYTIKNEVVAVAVV
jgi:hypothetical protein